jgi:CBS domain containing-hemolysin-like protein
MTLLIVVVVLTLCISGLCSLFEATLYSTRTGVLEAAKSHPTTGRLARRFLTMKQHIDAPIAAILILNTMANTAGATLAGMFAAHVFGTTLVVIFSVVFTLAILLLSEIVPKTLGVVYWRSLWSHIVWPLTAMTTLLYPAIYISQKLTRLLTAGHTGTPVTEEEILAMTRLGATVGEISAQESAMVHNIIHLETRQVREIMTPRPVVFTLHADLTVAEALPLVTQQGFTRVPIYEQTREHIVGYVTLHDLSSAHTLRQPEAQIKTIAKPISFVPETVNCLALLTTFLQQRWHIAVVVDEYGGVAGLVTLEDLIETILGTEIVDEADRVVDLRHRAQQLKRQRGVK